MSIHLAACLLLPGALLVSRGRVGLPLIVTAQYALVAVGVAALMQRGLASGAALGLLLVGLAALLLGYRAGGSPTASGTTPVLRRPLRDSTVWWVIAITAGFTAYHFAVGGVPLLSAEIERARFDFSGSGFFGVPGRMYLYGTKIAWMLASVNAYAKGERWTSSSTWWAATTVVGGSAVLSGFKGQALTLVVMGFLTCAALDAGRGVRLRVLAKYSWLFGAALFYFFLAASKYRTYDATGLAGWRLLADRLTSIGAEPGAFLLQRVVDGHSRLAAAGDAGYLLSKYVGGDVAGRYTLEREVSGAIYGVSPASSGWAPPVTIGGISEVLFNVGPVAGAAVLLLIGLAVRRLELRRTPSVVWSTAQVCVIFAAYTWIVRGGIAYTVINWLLVLGLVLGLAAMLEVLATSRARQLTKPTLLSAPGRSCRAR